jgi:anti-sigma B factor antagonist
MEAMNEMSNCMLCEEPVIREEEFRGQETEMEIREESVMKLHFETRQTDDGVTIVFCSGRIVYRDEAVALSHTVSRLLGDGRNIVLDLSGVETVDGAGLGHFVGLHNRALAGRSSIKLAGLNTQVRSLFDLTKLAPVFEIYPTVEEAAGGCQLSAVS